MNAPPTPLSTLETAKTILDRHLDYVYLGNVASSAGSDTICPRCGNIIIERVGYHARVVGLEGTRCARCGADAHIIVD